MQERLKIIKYYVNGCSGCCYVDTALARIQGLALKNHINTELIFHNADIFGKLSDDVTNEHDLMPQFIFYYNDKKYILKGMIGVKVYLDLIKKNNQLDKSFEIINNIITWFILGEMGINDIGINKKDNWITKEIKIIKEYLDNLCPYIKGGQQNGK